MKADYTEVWVPTPLVPLIRFADRVESLARTGIDLVEFGDTRALERFAEFDEIVCWYGTTRDSFREAVAQWPFQFHRALPDGSCHAVDFYARQVGAPDGLVPKLDVPLTPAPEPFVACHPFSGSRKKDWPHYLELAKKLPMRFCVGPEQSFPDAIHIENLWHLAEWLATARAYVGNDSGITHLAAAIRLPVVALFAETNPATWSPRGPQVTLLHQETLRVETVASTLLDL